MGRKIRHLPDRNHLVEITCRAIQRRFLLRLAPRFHALEPQVRRALEWGYRLFRMAYKQASEALREGKDAEFPDGCFIPGSFVPLRA